MSKIEQSAQTLVKFVLLHHIALYAYAAGNDLFQIKSAGPGNGIGQIAVQYYSVFYYLGKSVTHHVRIKR